jgi:N-acetylglucosamine-6-phosphate deacetylase
MRELEALLKYACVIQRVTLAPELPGAMEAVRELVGNGIAVSAGHSDATREEAAVGFLEGISQVTHLYNAMSSLRKGREGLAEEALGMPGILCELIADEVHLPVELLRNAYLAKGWEEIALVSDASAGAGLQEGSQFSLGGLPCEISGGAAWTGGPEHSLAGSTSYLLRGIRTMVDLVGVPLCEAVAMATLVPARSLRLDDRIGSLAPGKRADIILVSRDWTLRNVWIGGEVLPSRENPESDFNPEP